MQQYSIPREHLIFRTPFVWWKFPRGFSVIFCDFGGISGSVAGVLLALATPFKPFAFK
jgi:hypothetical protein